MPRFNHLFSFGSRGANDGQFNWPYGIAINQNDQILIADSENNRIQMLSADSLKMVNKIVSKFRYPTSVAIGDQKVVVCDSGNNCLKILNLEGSLDDTIYSINEDGFNYPKGLTIDREGYILVADTWNHQIKIINLANKQIIKKLGRRGKASGEFACPCSVVTNTNNQIVVTDTCNDRVQMFGADGLFIRKFGSPGKYAGQFNNPRCAVIDSMDNIIVSDTLNNRIQIFDKDGLFIDKFGRYGCNNNQFHNPDGLAINSHGHLFVADAGNSRVQVFNCS